MRGAERRSLGLTLAPTFLRVTVSLSVLWHPAVPRAAGRVYVVWRLYTWRGRKSAEQPLARPPVRDGQYRVRRPGMDWAAVAAKSPVAWDIDWGVPI